MTKGYFHNRSLYESVKMSTWFVRRYILSTAIRRSRDLYQECMIFKSFPGDSYAQNVFIVQHCSVVSSYTLLRHSSPASHNSHLSSRPKHIISPTPLIFLMHLRALLFSTQQQCALAQNTLSLQKCLWYNLNPYRFVKCHHHPRKMTPAPSHWKGGPRD